MEEEIKCGEYIRFKRTNATYIRKVTDIYTKSNRRVKILVLDSSYNGCTYSISEKKVINHKENIMELIVEGDFVELEYYIKTRRGRRTRRFEIKRFGNILKFENMYCIFHYDLQEKKWLDGKGYNPKIKRIVTREKFESLGYEV